MSVSDEVRKLPGVTDLAGIQILNKNALRRWVPEVGQRYAIRSAGSGHVRGPYVIARMCGLSYDAVPLMGIAEFPYAPGRQSEEPGAVEDWRPDYDEEDDLSGSTEGSVSTT